MDNFNIANFLQGAPTGLILFSRFCSQSLEFNKVILHEFSEHEGPQRIIECVKYDDDGNLTDEKVYFDAYGRIKKSFYGNIIDTNVDLMPDDVNEWNDAGICALISESPMCIGKVLADKFDPDDNLESPWFIGNTAMWSFDNAFDNDWSSVRFHKFDFSNVRFATEEETKEFFDILHKFGSDFKDGTPINKGTKNVYKTRKLEELDEEIEKTRNKLKDLHDKRAALTSKLKFDNIQVGKMYKFYDPDAALECVYYGVITSISYDSKNRSWKITYAGIFNNLVHDANMFEDCQYGGFDADGEVIIPCHNEDLFIKNCTPIDKYEYFQAVDALYSNINERSNYWLAKCCER